MRDPTARLCLSCGAQNAQPFFGIGYCNTCRVRLTRSTKPSAVRSLTEATLWQRHSGAIVWAAVVMAFLAAVSLSNRSNGAYSTAQYTPPDVASPSQELPTRDELVAALRKADAAAEAGDQRAADAARRFAMAIRDMDASGGVTPQPAPAQPVQPAPCLTPPRSGDLLRKRIASPEYGHSLTVKNGTKGDAIIKVRDAVTKKLKLSMFVGRSSAASFDDLPDGSYTIQFGYGDALAADCKSFVRVLSAQQFPGVERFVTRYVGNQVQTETLELTLFPVLDGNVETREISSTEFSDDADR